MTKQGKGKANDSRPNKPSTAVGPRRVTRTTSGSLPGATSRSRSRVGARTVNPDIALEEASPTQDEGGHEPIPPPANDVDEDVPMAETDSTEPNAPNPHQFIDVDVDESTADQATVETILAAASGKLGLTNGSIQVEHRAKRSRTDSVPGSERTSSFLCPSGEVNSDVGTSDSIPPASLPGATREDPQVFPQAAEPIAGPVPPTGSTEGDVGRAADDTSLGRHEDVASAEKSGDTGVPPGLLKKEDTPFQVPFQTSFSAEGILHTLLQAQYNTSGSSRSIVSSSSGVNADANGLSYPINSMVHHAVTQLQQFHGISQSEEQQSLASELVDGREVNRESIEDYARRTVRLAEEHVQVSKNQLKLAEIDLKCARDILERYEAIKILEKMLASTDKNGLVLNLLNLSRHGNLPGPAMDVVQSLVRLYSVYTPGPDAAGDGSNKPSGTTTKDPRPRNNVGTTSQLPVATARSSRSVATTQSQPIAGPSRSSSRLGMQAEGSADAGGGEDADGIAAAPPKHILKRRADD